VISERLVSRICSLWVAIPLAGDEGSARELAHAIDLVELARSIGTESIGVAAHPNGHPSAFSREADRDRLAEKLRLADFAITQFFFHADEYLRLVDDLGARGVHQPVIAGVMPITNLRSISRMATLSGLSVPSDVTERLDTAGGSPGGVPASGNTRSPPTCVENSWKPGCPASTSTR